MTRPDPYNASKEGRGGGRRGDGRTQRMTRQFLRQISPLLLDARAPRTRVTKKFVWELVCQNWELSTETMVLSVLFSFSVTSLLSAHTLSMNMMINDNGLRTNMPAPGCSIRKINTRRSVPSVIHHKQWSPMSSQTSQVRSKRSPRLGYLRQIMAPP